MLLSFIVPVYNTELYLAECLNSLLSQDISTDEYEIICINDGSTDGSLQILREFEISNTNVTVIDKENEGVSIARNIGLSVAKGDYIWFVDSDDLIQCNILSELKKSTEESNPDIVDFGSYAFNENLSVAEKQSYLDNSLPVTSYANAVYITKSLFKKSFIQDNDVWFNEQLAYSEDSVFKCQCLINNPQITIIRKAFYLIRYRESSATASKSSQSFQKKFNSWYNATIIFLDLYKKCKTELKSTFADLLMSNLWSVLVLLISLPYSQSKPYFKDLKNKKLFPFKKPVECTLNRSYQTNRDDIVGKIYDWIYTNTHRKSGLALMYIWNRIYVIIKKR